MINLSQNEISRHIIASSTSLDFSLTEVRDNFRKQQITIIFEYLHSDWETQKTKLTELNSVTQQILVKYAHVKGMKFLPIFDGFDFMSAADHFLDIKNYRWLIAASELIGDWDSEVALPNFNLRMNMNFIVVLRENTFTAFTAKHKMVPFQSIIDKRFILAPSSKALFDTSIRRLFYNLRQSMEIDQAAVDATRDLAQNITMEVIEQLEVHRNGFSYSDVFNQNAREMLIFMRFVILMLTAQALESIPKSRRKEVEPGSFLENLISMKFDEFLIHRGYRLVEILLFEDHRNFSNSLRVDFRKFAELRDSISDVQFNWGDGNIDPSTVFQEYELGAGFVDTGYPLHSSWRE